ncbi:hypothetical protein Q7C36_018182 [Tachysurus vachellii]|uniref:Uncharacterized protein n=1 Tax=Tachysurus vachellii TaxID=175792 RepID=A0AA88LZ83_TACVA|nr:hypothetical protein Q7C36_018182 [Tachysurus vachellii]
MFSDVLTCTLFERSGGFNTNFLDPASHSSPGALDGNGDFYDMKAAPVPVKRRFSDAPPRHVCTSAMAARVLSN